MPPPTRPHHTFWPKRLPHSLTPPATSLWDNLEISARRYPDKPALIFFGRVFSYSELRDTAQRLAARLHDLGVRKGDRVLLDMQNCPQLVIAHFAILRANAVVVPVNPMNRAEEFKHYIDDAGSQGRDHDGRPGELKSRGPATRCPPAGAWQHLIVQPLHRLRSIPKPRGPIALPDACATGS